MILISIEGNIGVGKSTVLSKVRTAFEGDPRVGVVDEPVELWKRSGLLQAVYDKSLSAAVFQRPSPLMIAAPSSSRAGSAESPAGERLRRRNSAAGAAAAAAAGAAAVPHAAG